MTAKERLGGGAARFPRAHRAVNFFQTGLESFDPEAGRYDALWIQWAMLYLTDGARGGCMVHSGWFCEYLVRPRSAALGLLPTHQATACHRYT